MANVTKGLNLFFDKLQSEVENIPYVGEAVFKPAYNALHKWMLDNLADELLTRKELSEKQAMRLGKTPEERRYATTQKQETTLQPLLPSNQFRQRYSGGAGSATHEKIPIPKGGYSTVSNKITDLMPIMPIIPSSPLQAINHSTYDTFWNPYAVSKEPEILAYISPSKSANLDFESNQNENPNAAFATSGFSKVNKKRSKKIYKVVI